MATLIPGFWIFAQSHRRIALDAVKAAADRIAPSHDDDGLVQVVRWVLE